MPDLPTCVVADDHGIVRDAIRSRLDRGRYVRVVGEAADGTQALERVRELRPDILLLDVRMPGMDGLEVATAVTKEGLPTRVLMLSALADPALVERSFAAGAAGYVAKESHRDILAAALRAVAAGEQFVDPSIAGRMIGTSRQRLSPRESQVLELIADGKQNPEIAAALGVSVETVRNHAASILSKLDAATRTQAVAQAFRQSLLT
jgi:two-component system nitrate/nitrite response regulator NarL